MNVPSQGAKKLKSAVNHIRVPEAGAPFIVGSRCLACHEVFVGERATCAKCGSRGKMCTLRLSETGCIHTYSVVHRSFPGIKTPFVSAMVTLDGGGHVQSTVRNVTTDASAVLFGLPVKLHFEVTDQLDPEGAHFLAYYFSPIDETEGIRNG